MLQGVALVSSHHGLVLARVAPGDRSCTSSLSILLFLSSSPVYVLSLSASLDAFFSLCLSFAYPPAVSFPGSVMHSSCLLNDPAPATVQAASAALVCFVPGSSFLNLIVSIFDFLLCVSGSTLDPCLLSISVRIVSRLLHFRLHIDLPTERSNLQR